MSGLENIEFKNAESATVSTILNSVELLGAPKQLTHSDLLAQSSTAETEESVVDMFGRILVSAGSGCLTRQSLFMLGVHRIPRIGPVCTVLAPFVASGVTSSYMRTGEFTDPRGLAEGVLSYGFLAQGFNTASRDIGFFIEKRMFEKGLLPLQQRSVGIHSANRPFRWEPSNVGWDEEALKHVVPRRPIGRLTSADGTGLRSQGH
jgi:hypothetical protein